MKRIVIAVMLVAAPAFAAENPAPKAEEAIKAAFSQFDTCVAKAEPKCVGDFFADDATLAGLTGSATVVKGKAEITNALRATINEPFMKGVKRSVQNVRMIGQDHALVDGSVKIATAKAPEGAGQTWHFTALMTLKSGKWLVQDIRSFVLEPVQPPTCAQPSPPAAAPAPTQAATPAQPAEPPKS
jgi:uncharacterized protein (TIGR02246 family)